MKSPDIQTFSQSLESSMRLRLEVLLKEEDDHSKRLIKSVSIVGVAIMELRTFTVAYEFQNVQEEILFFKEIKPRFVSEYYFSLQLMKLKTNEPVLKSHKIDYYNEALQGGRRILEDHSEFYFYFLSGSAYLDECYFTRGMVSPNEIFIDRAFSAKNDDLLSRLMAARLLNEYLNNELIQLSGEQSKMSSLTWTGSKTDLIELIYGLETIGVFNKGNADIKDIATLFESMFNITLGNFYRQFLDIKLRKKGKTTFLDDMKEKLEVRISDFG